MAEPPAQKSAGQESAGQPPAGQVPTAPERPPGEQALQQPPSPPSPTPQPVGAQLSPEELKAALKAFNRRLRLTRLDDESRLGHGAMTGGGKSGIVAIMPPNQFPRAVWDELVRQGKLRYVGHGLYEPAGK